MTRVAVALAVVIALAAGVWLLWPDDERPPSTTVPVAASSPTSSTVPAPSTTSTSSETGHVVETVEEAEEILRELWFGWFEGIYDQDEARIREVVIRDDHVAEATTQFGESGFSARPRPEDISFEATEILRSDAECLATWTRLSTSSFSSGSSEAVHVLRWIDERWKSLSIWRHRNDLWEADCSVSLP